MTSNHSSRPPPRKWSVLMNSSGNLFGLAPRRKSLSRTGASTRGGVSFGLVRLLLIVLFAVVTTTTILLLASTTHQEWWGLRPLSSSSLSQNGGEASSGGNPSVYHRGASFQSSSSSSQLRVLPEQWRRQDGHSKDLSGTYLFQGTQACRNKHHQDSSSACQIHFPADARSHRLACDASSSSSQFCVRTRKGFKPSLDPMEDHSEIPNQDRSLVIHPLSLVVPTTSSSTTGEPYTVESDCRLLLLADGHGPEGHVVASAVQRDLPFRILHHLEAMATPTSSSPHTTHNWNVPAVLNQAFVECDQQVAQKVGQNSGATTIVVLQIGTTVYLASLGDSTAVVAQWNPDNDDSTSNNNHNNKHANQKKTTTTTASYTILAQAKPHKADVPEERHRIQQHGGQVQEAMGDGDSSRVIIPYQDEMGRTMAMALAMSRAMGDTDGKRAGLLLAEPTILTLSFADEKPSFLGDNVIHVNNKNNQKNKKNQYFVMVSSDGVVDHHPLSHVLEQSGHALFGSQKQQEPPLGKTLDSILDTSAQGWAQASFSQYRDDMTMILSRLEFTNRG